MAHTRGHPLKSRAVENCTGAALESRRKDVAERHVVSERGCRQCLTIPFGAAEQQGTVRGMSPCTMLLVSPTAVVRPQEMVREIWVIHHVAPRTMRSCYVTRLRGRAGKVREI